MIKSAIVTGASGGIGSQICSDFSAAGFRIIGIDKRPSKWTDGHSLDLADGDVATRIGELFDTAGLKSVVHAAAAQPLDNMASQDRNTWERTLRINLLAMDEIVKRFHGELSKNSGSVVFIGSVHTLVSRASAGVYAVSKAAGEAWVRSAAIDYAPDLRVNSVIPGAIEAGMLAEYVAASSSGKAGPMDRIRRRTPIKRIGVPRDISAASLFLTSSDASFITGQSLVVDGGASLLLATEVE